MSDDNIRELVFCKNEDISFEKFDDLYISTIEATNRVYVLNETCMFIINKAKSIFTFDDTVEILLKEYDVEENEAEQDSISILKHLLEIEVIWTA